MKTVQLELTHDEIALSLMHMGKDITETVMRTQYEPIPELMDALRNAADTAAVFAEELKRQRGENPSEEFKEERNRETQLAAASLLQKLVEAHRRIHKGE